MSPNFIRLDNKSLIVNDGKKQYINQTIIDGEKGLTILIIIQENEKKTKIYVKQLSKDKYEFQETVDEGKTTKKEITSAELSKLLKTHKLDMIRNYLAENKGLSNEDKEDKKTVKKTTKKTTKKQTAGSKKPNKQTIKSKK